MATSNTLYLVNQVDAEYTHFSDAVVLSLEAEEVKTLSQRAEKSEEVRALCVSGPSSVRAAVGGLTLLKDERLPDLMDEEDGNGVRATIFDGADPELASEHLIRHPNRMASDGHIWTIYPQGMLVLSCAEKFGEFFTVGRVNISDLGTALNTLGKDRFELTDGWFLFRY